MNKILFALLASTFMTVGSSAVAADRMDSTNMMKMDMKKFDANSDGMISKEEYMKYQEWMFDNMPKNKGGQLTLNAMQMRHRHMGMYKDTQRSTDPLSKP